MQNSLLKFLLRGLALVSILIGMVFAILAANSDLIPSKSYILSDFKNVFLPTAHADLIVLGNSKALCSVSSKVLQENLHLVAYNLAYEAADLEFSRKTLEAYLSRCRVKPKYCLLEVSWFSFNPNRTAFPEDISVCLKFKEYRRIFCPNTPYSLAFKFARSAAILWRRCFGGDPQPGEWGTDAASARREYLPFSKTEMEKSFPGYLAGIDPRLLREFYEIITLCEKEKVTLILYTAPEAPEYTALQKDRTRIREEIGKAVREHRLRYLDFTAEGTCWDRSLAANLLDSHHVRDNRQFTGYFLQSLLGNNIDLRR